MIVVVPDTAAVTRPEELMVATEGLLLLHTPPAGLPDRVAVVPLHRVVMPVMVCPTATYAVAVRNDIIKNNRKCFILSTVGIVKKYSILGSVYIRRNIMCIC